MRGRTGNFVSANALQSTMRELQRLIGTPRFWAAMAGAALLLGLIGPFGTYDGLRLPARLAYWAATAVATYLVGYGVVVLLQRLHLGERMPGPLAFGLYGAVAGVPVTLVVWGINVATFEGGDTIPLLPLGAYTVAISAVVSALVALFSREFEKARAQPAASASEAPKRPKILDRLPAPQRGRLSHMTMQDHYVELRTDRGGGLVLMRFADAIAEAEGVEGLQIHRSHWVALDMVAETVRLGGRPMVRMKDGTLLPVSRGFLEAARKAGLV
jgi:hypothetical protein